jgi:PadR family transcriptional regulator PadR
MSDQALGQLEQVVLLAILRVGKHAYGNPILREIEERTGRTIARGALYVTLDRLEAKGLIVSSTGEASAGRGGRPIRYVSVTPAGKRALAQARHALLSMWNGLDGVLERP